MVNMLRLVVRTEEQPVVLIEMLFNIIRMSSVREQREVVLRSPGQTPAQWYQRKVLIDFTAALASPGHQLRKSPTGGDWFTLPVTPCLHLDN